MIETFKTYAPGLALVIIVAVISQIVAHSLSAPAMLIALLIGFAASPVTANASPLAPGLTWSAKTLLQIGVALLGLRISFSDFYTLGADGVTLLVLGIISTMVLGLILAKHFLKSSTLGVLTGGATAICGVSAAMALAAVLPPSREKDQQIAVTVVGVTLLSSIAMAVYPIIANYFGLSDQDAGLFFGATIHNVPQVVGAGYIFSNEAAEFATLTKLIRISFLLPVILTVWWAFKSRQESVHTAKAIPKFLIAFFILVGVNEVLDLPGNWVAAIGQFTKFALLCVIAAIGMTSDVKKSVAISLGPFCLMLVETLWLAGFALAYIHFF